MEFLKTILGDALYAQLEQALTAYNGDAAHKDTQVKLGNLGGGEYVGKGKFDALQAELTGKNTELQTANALIADLKKSGKGNEELQQKVTQYESAVQALQGELQKTRLDSAVKVELLANKALDVDYLTYKLSEGGELALDEGGKIKGWEDKLAGLKARYPGQFEAPGKPQVLPNKLPENGDHAFTREELLKKPYAERARIFAESPEAFQAAMKNE